LPVGSDASVVARIEDALVRAAAVLQQFQPGAVKFEYKAPRHPVTEADRRVNEMLRETLVRDGEGWLSEESTDEPARLQRERVWIVDPVDGTQEFIDGIPEWGVSIAYVENGSATAGGILNPVTRETFLGSCGSGVTLNGQRVRVSERTSLTGAVVLASRSEVRRGEWQKHAGAPFQTRAVGSVAYKLALVAAGMADATWSAKAKHEWDIAAGVALVEAAGGVVRSIGGEAIRFNRPNPRVPGLIACAPALYDQIAGLNQL
jgi:myo-inositol-1(or 4)-monophosphatase